MRKAFNISSNAYLEIQWYLFAAVFLLAAGYTLLQRARAHRRRSPAACRKRTQIWIDIIGFVFFLCPMCIVIMLASACRSSCKASTSGRDVVQRRRPDPLAGVPAGARSASPCCCCKACPS